MHGSQPVNGENSQKPATRHYDLMNVWNYFTNIVLLGSKST